MAFQYRDIAPDPVLTGFAVEYGVGGGFLADRVAPVVPVASPHFKFPTYKQAKLDDDVVTALGPGDSANEILRQKPTYDDAYAKRYAVKDKIVREVQLAPGVNPLGSAQVATAVLTSRLRLGVEKRIKTILDAAGTAANAGVKWDAASGVNVEKDFDDHREAFLKGCGREANLAVIPPHLAKLAKRDPAIRELRKYTDPSLVVNGDLPNVLWGISIVIPGALENTAAPGLAQDVARIWDANTVYLLYVDPSFGGAGMGMTAVGQFRWNEWGGAYAAYTWPDPDKTVKADHIAVEHHQTEKLVCSAAVRRLTNVI